MSAAGTRRAPSPALIRAVWAVVALLVALGVFAAAGRTVFLDDFIARAEPVRLWNMTALGRDDPRALERPAEALAHLKKAAQLDPAEEIPQFHLAQVYRAAGDAAAQQRALTEFRRLRQLKSDGKAAGTPRRDVTRQEAPAPDGI